MTASSEKSGPAQRTTGALSVSTAFSGSGAVPTSWSSLPSGSSVPGEGFTARWLPGSPGGKQHRVAGSAQAGRGARHILSLRPEPEPAEVSRWDSWTRSGHRAVSWPRSPRTLRARARSSSTRPRPSGGPMRCSAIWGPRCTPSGPAGAARTARAGSTGWSTRCPGRRLTRGWARRTAKTPPVEPVRRKRDRRERDRRGRDRHEQHRESGTPGTGPRESGAGKGAAGPKRESDAGPKRGERRGAEEREGDAPGPPEGCDPGHRLVACVLGGGAGRRRG